MTTYINAYTLTCSIGTGLSQIRDSLKRNIGGLRSTPWRNSQVEGWYGVVDIPNEVQVGDEYISRNNRLLNFALQQDGFLDSIKNNVDIQNLGLVLGTSTSSIDRTEDAYLELTEDGTFAPEYVHQSVHNPHAPTAYASELLGCKGPSMTVSVACASGAKVFGIADRWLSQNLVDADVVGAVDSLCLSTVYGFNSLQLISPQKCSPFSKNRAGISLGEAAGFALMTREATPASIRFLGLGESCDAFHMSSAHPDGIGAQLAIERALDSANLEMSDVDYINLHGTGTRANDSIEGSVCAKMLSGNVQLSATKGWTGHTLGAAGFVESVICFEALRSQVIPGTMNTTEPDAPFAITLENTSYPIEIAINNSFGFGGNNCSVVFGR